jgi:hypothetical protein
MRVFRTRWFTRYARQERIADKSLRDAIARAERGLIDADLGGGLIKQRVARQGQGRSGGYRTIIAYRAGSSAFFCMVLQRATETISARMSSGRRLLSADVETLNGMFEDGSLKEVDDD